MRAAHALLVLALVVASTAAVARAQPANDTSVVPEQVLIAATGRPDEMTIQWITMSQTKNYMSGINVTFVQYGDDPAKLDTTVAGEDILFTDNATLHINRTVHTTKLTGLAPGTRYFYRVGFDCPSTNAWSSVLNFTTLTNGKEVVTMAVYGDMGVVNGQSVQNIIAEAQNGTINIVLHVGDFAYDLHTNNGSVGDTFMNEIQPISSTIPYMGCVGNHEMKWNGSHYTNRFSAFNNANTGHNWWYSWDYVSGDAVVHMVAFSSEVYYIFVDENPPPDLMPQVVAQYAWLDADLTAARARGVDWIVMYSHRPMYCSNTDDVPDCTSDAELLRKGINGTAYGMEEILYKHNVDLYLCGHEHSYERMFPVYRGQVDPQQNHTYTNPAFPVHIVTGSAGCQEYFDTYDEVFYGPWSVVRSATYGYGHLTVHNSTHLYWDQVLAEGAGGRDYMWMVKDPKKW